MTPGETRPAAQALERPATGAEWWRGAVIYQIYPRSFKDSNADGVGDLKGVFEGLDYVASLGVDGVWLSPFFTSPMRDFGYDVADFCNVDPVFGALADFDAVVEKAHRLGLKVIIDQVYSHTSDQHPWFVESRRSKSNPKSDWYVWADPKPEGSPPNNWQSVFGGPAWTWDSRRRQYYFHNFLSSQPDLNLHNREVQDAILNVTRFWLDRGVDGFRLDALNFAMHDPELRDNPPAPRDGRKLTRPFDYQLHKYNMSHPDIESFLERLRGVLDEYEDVFTVAEIGGPEPLAEMKAFTADDRRLNSAYSFDFLYAEKLTAAHAEKSLTAWTGAPGEGWPSWAFSNHDAPRAVSRWAREEDRDRAARLYAMLLLSLRGNVFLYQGEELGLPQADVPFEALRDPEAIVNWPLTLGRDGARTPMPWKRGAINSGFSSGAPWLPVDPRHDDLSVDLQEANQWSTLHFVRKLIRIRRDSAALRLGAIEFFKAPEGVIAFARSRERERVISAFNVSAEEKRWKPEGVSAAAALASLGLGQIGTQPPENLPALSGYIAQVIR
ncbi:MAG: alpha-glucosidase [Parvularculaceae bacterium]|nr:alpha-glucosidase [Parvularculaceae bacterium]